MHATDHKHAACMTPPWQRKNADRVCQHGDTRLLGDLKRRARQARRAQDKREASR